MKSKGTKIFIVVLILVILTAGGILAYKIWKDKQNDNSDETIVLEPEEGITNAVKKEIQIYSGTDRPIAVMIDNHNKAWPQGGLNDAYMVYEIIVEGGETRLMAVFKGADVKKIGPVRSSRHYFLDYAMENDAIYVHYGWSPQAQKDIVTYKINNINGITESSSNFWRVKDKSAPHNAVTSTENILSMAKNKGYRTTSTQSSVLNYVADDYELVNKYTTTDTTTNEIIQTTSIDVLPATDVIIPHSTLQKVEYKYDAETKRYTRYARNKLQTEWSTKDNITTKNIIIEFVDNYTLTDSENKGRQGLSNIGTFDGYYITNGEAIKIKCTKSARNEKTVYKDLDGNVIDINDGNTWVNICPKDAKVTLN